VLPVAGGFSTAAGTRPRLRPVFARAAIGRLAQIIRSDSGAGAGTSTAAGGLQGKRILVADARTGILAGQLARAGLAVWALEADQELAVQLKRSLPQVAVSCASLSALAVKNASIDLFCIEQSDTQADTSFVAQEVHRVLRPQAMLALLVNLQDLSEPWEDELALLKATEPAPLTARPTVQPAAELMGVSEYFSDTIRESFAHPVQSSVTHELERLRSSAAVAQMLPAEQAVLLDNAQQVLSDHADLTGALEHKQHTELLLWRAI